jgi:hypothetical protein
VLEVGNDAGPTAHPLRGAHDRDAWFHQGVRSTEAGRLLRATEDRDDENRCRAIRLRSSHPRDRQQEGQSTSWRETDTTSC